MLFLLEDTQDSQEEHQYFQGLRHAVGSQACEEGGIVGPRKLICSWRKSTQVNYKLC